MSSYLRMFADDVPVEASADWATEGVIFAGWAPPSDGSFHAKSRIPGGYDNAWDRCRKRVNEAIFDQCQDTINELVKFAQQNESTQDSGLGISEIPTALVVSRDRALISAVLSQVAYALMHRANEPTEGKGKRRERVHPLVVQLDEGDCTNATSALRVLITRFLAQFEDANTKGSMKKATMTLAPFDMARLVAGYDDCYSSREYSPNLVVILDRMEAYDAEVMQDLLYACSKYLDSLPFVFITTLSETSYLQRAFTTATRAMLDPTVFRPPSGAALCSEVIQEALYDYESPYDILLGESSIKALKDIIDKSDGRIEALITALQLIYMEHYRYQGPLLEAVPSLHEEHNHAEQHTECVRRVEQAEPSVRDALMALMFIYKRKDPLSDGFRISNSQDLDRNQYNPETMVAKLHMEHLKTVQNMKTLSYGLNILHYLTWRFNALGSYHQEVPLGFLDLLELDARGGDHLEKYATWMLKKGFESTSVSDAADLVRDVFKKHIARGGVNYDLPYSAELSEVANHLWESQVKDGVDFSVEDRTQLVFYFTKHISSRFGLSHTEPYSELYYTETSSGLKEVLDPTPRSVVLSALTRPGAYFNCECCDPEESFAPESIAQRPDTCILFQRSLDAGRLLNLADWFGAFVAVVQHEKVDRMSAPTATTSTHSLRTRRRRSLGPDDGDGDDMAEIRKEYQARFIQSAHELEFLGLIQATGRRKEHVMRTVFETGD